MAVKPTSLDPERLRAAAIAAERARIGTLCEQPPEEWEGLLVDFPESMAAMEAALIAALEVLNAD